MPFSTKSYDGGVPYIILGDYTNAPTVILRGYADPGTPTSSAKWRVHQDTYDASGNLLSSYFLNKSNKFDQVWDNRSAAGAVWG